jgi:hypothetical protein
MAMKSPTEKPKGTAIALSQLYVALAEDYDIMHD